MCSHQAQQTVGPASLPDPDDRDTAVSGAQTTNPQLPSAIPLAVAVKLGDLFPLLLDALAGDRMWLEDFSDEPLSISPDLHDLLMAYRNFLHEG